jgi:hypothetical protein
MSDPKANVSKQISDLLGSVFTTLEPFYAGVKDVEGKLTKATADRAAKRRELADKCAAAAVAGNWSAKDIKAAAIRAINDYKGNAIEKKTLQNISGELKNVMDPKVRAQMPELRKLTDSVFAASTPDATDVQKHFQGKKDFMVARMATAIIKDDVKMPKSLNDMVKIVAARNVGKAEDVGAAKRMVEAIAEKVSDALKVFSLSEFAKIKACCDALLKEDVLKDALARAKAQKKNEGNLRKASNRRAPAMPANGASDIVTTMNAALN